MKYMISNIHSKTSFEFNSRNLILLSTILAISFYYYLIHKSDFLYLQYDAYYYAAVADGYAETGDWQNIVTKPASALRTPQNGIIIIHSLLIKLGLTNIKSRLQLLSFIHTILIIIISWLCFILYIHIGIDRTASWLLSLSLAMSFYYYMVLLQAINDALFITLSFISIILISKFKLNWKILFILTLIAITLPQFRITGILVFITATIVNLLFKQYRNTLLFILLTVISALSPIIVNYLLGFEMGGLGERSEEIVSSYNMAYFSGHLYHTLSLNLPEALFRLSYFTFTFTIANPWLGFFISLILILLFIKTSFIACYQKNRPLLFILLFILLNLIAFQLHPAQPTRYLLVCSPLLVVIFYFYGKYITQRQVSTGFIIIAIFISSLGILISNKPNQASQKKYFSNYLNSYTEQSSYNLLSYFPRTSYFLLNKSSNYNLTNVIKNKRDYLLIIGPKNYQALIFDKIQGKKLDFTWKKLPITYMDYLRSSSPTFGFDYEKKIIYVYKVEFK